MTYQIALCDDETAELEKIEKLLSAYEKEHTGANFCIARFEHTEELLDRVREQRYTPDLVFMDICMPGAAGKTVPLGMEAAKRLRDMGSRAWLFFLTMSKEYALDAFDVEASGYLLKPVSKDKLSAALDKFRKDAEREWKRYVILRVEGRLQKVLLNNIVYCEAQGKRQCLYMADGTELFQTLTIVRLYEMLACQELVKVGASYIIHLEHIDSLNAKEVCMDNGHKIYLPRGTYRGLREQYFDYFCGGGGRDELSTACADDLWTVFRG